MYLVIDLEATCWKKSTERQGENEIIEIGCVVLDKDYRILGEVQTFVRPVRNPVLSNFCRQLTSIAQSQVDSAPLFPDALRDFQVQVEALSGQKFSDLLFCSWGNYDREQLMQDCEYHDVPYPFGLHRSLKHEFAEKHNIRPVGMRRAMRILEIPLEGKRHRAIDDAWNLATIFRVEWGGINPEKRKRRIRFWIAVLVGFAVALISSATNVPSVLALGVLLGAFVAGAVANGARRGGPAAFLVVFFWGIAWLLVLPSLGVSTVVSLGDGSLPTSIALVFAISIFALILGFIAGLLGRLIRYLARSFYFPIGREKEISYVLPNACYVDLSVHNLLGHRTKTLVDEYQSAGHKSIMWDGTDEEGNIVVSGIYFYRMKTDESTHRKKMMPTKQD
jgi:3'-5' exoribonuclease 1